MKPKSKQTPIVVGLCGRKGVGKNAVARLMTAAYGFKEVSFAYHLRLELLARFPELSMVDLTSLSTKEIYRPLMQWYGTEFRRHQDPNYWIDKLRPEVEQHLSEGTSVIITDVRFANELDFVHSFNGTTMLIEGDKSPHVDMHQSEEAFGRNAVIHTVFNSRFNPSNTALRIDTIMRNKNYTPIDPDVTAKWLKSLFK